MTDRRRPSLRVYAAGLITLVLVGLSVFSWVVTFRVDSLVAQTEAQNDRLAREELLATVETVMSNVATAARKLADWDETQQQLRQSSYYEYWRDQRVREAGLSGIQLLSVALYDAQGKPLGIRPAGAMPPRISVGTPVWWLAHAGSQETAALFHVQPIRGRGKRALQKGYVVVAIDLVGTIADVQRFRRIAPESLQVSGRRTSVESPGDLTASISYRLAPNRPFEQLRVILQDTLWEFGALAAVLLLLSVYLLVTLGSMPLARLSQYIDRLGRDGVDHTEPPSTLMPLAEFDKVRGSLADFQYRLTQGDLALRDSETRMRAVLQNVVDGILTFDADGYITSANPAVEHLFGHAAERLIGRHVSALFDGLPIGVLHRLASRLEADGDRWASRRMELQGVHQDGTRFPAEMTLSRLDLPGVLSFIAVVENISERKEAEQRLKYMANYDTLTGLPNRALLCDRLEHAMRQAERAERLVGVLFLDLDRFKNINDTLGHHAGDQLLKVVAERLRRCVRNSDTVARLGGDEFMVIVENMGHVDEAVRVAQSIRASFESPISIEERDVFVTPSIGITFYPLDDSTADALLRNADSAMYRAKAMGGDGVQFFTQALNDQASERLALENALRQALAKSEFDLHYQPRVCVSSGRVLGVEALLRWNHPELGNVTPDRFIPVLEDTGQIDAVGAWVLRRACEQSVAWRSDGLAPMRMAVNISARQIRSGHLVPLVDQVLADTGLPPDGLELEITESAMIENIEDTADTLHQLTRRGIHIALDDFGTGYSALSYLRRFPIDTLKIDRSFISEVPDNADDARVVSALVAIAESLDMRVTAEGVETPAQLRFLRGLGCDEVQGFLISRPQPAANLCAWLAARSSELHVAR